MRLIKENEKWLYHPTDKLRELILENPDLPIVVLATEDAYSDDCGGSTVCSNVSCWIDDVLSPTSLTDERIFVGKNEFEEWLRDSPTFQDEHSEDSDEEFELAVNEQMALFDEDWISAIVVMVGN